MRKLGITRKELIDSYADWLATFDWQWFVVLTFSQELSERAANRRFNRWIGEIQRLTGTEQFRWVRIAERGQLNNRRHLHVVIGGTEEFYAKTWATRWDQLAGRAWIKPFDVGRNRDGLLYMLKQLQPGEDYDLDLELDTPRRYIKEREDQSPEVTLQQRGSHSGCSELPRAGVKVQQLRNELIITLPLASRGLSKSGKSCVVGSTGGVLPTFAKIDGHFISLNANAWVYLDEVPWKERARATLARWQGRLEGTRHES